MGVRFYVKNDKDYFYNIDNYEFNEIKYKITRSIDHDMARKIREANYRYNPWIYTCLKRKKFDQKTINFLLAPIKEGCLSNVMCETLLTLLNQNLSHNSTMTNFIQILSYCVENHCYLWWEEFVDDD